MANGDDNQGNGNQGNGDQGNGNQPEDTSASNVALGKQAALLEAITKEYEKQIKARERLARITKTAADPLEKQIEQQELIMNSSLEMLRILEKEGEQRIALLVQKKKDLDRDLESGKITQELYQAQLEALQEMGEAGEEATATLVKGYEDAIIAADKAEKAFRKARDGMESMKSSAEGAAGALADVVGIAGKGQSVIGGFVDGLIQAGKGGKAIDGLKGSFMAFAKELTGRFSIGNVLAFQAKNTFDVANASDKANAQIKRLTGLSRDFINVTQKAYLETARFYSTIEEANAAMAGLSSTFVGFSHASDDTLSSLAATSITLEKFGISAQEQGQILTDLQKGFGETGESGMASFKSLVESAREFGIQPQEIGRSFSALFPQIAMFGQRSRQEMLDIARIGKATGISTGKIFNLQESFMDFEKSAQMAAGLNVAFGEQLFDTYELTKRSYEGTDSLISYIQETAQGANKSVEEMLDNPALSRFLSLQTGQDALTVRKMFLGTTEVPKIDTKTMEDELAGRATSVADKTVSNVQHASDAFLKVGNAAIDLAHKFNDAFAALSPEAKAAVTGAVGVGSSMLNMLMTGAGIAGGVVAAKKFGPKAVESLKSVTKGAGTGGGGSILKSGKDLVQGIRGTGAAQGLTATGFKFGAGARDAAGKFTKVSPAMKAGLELQSKIPKIKMPKISMPKSIPGGKAGKIAGGLAAAGGLLYLMMDDAEASPTQALAATTAAGGKQLAKKAAPSLADLAPKAMPAAEASLIDVGGGALGVGSTAAIGAGIGKLSGKGAMSGAKGAFKGAAPLSLAFGAIEGGYEAATMEAGGATEEAERLQKFAQTTAAATVSGITFGLLNQQYLDEQMTAATNSLESSGFFDSVADFFGESDAETKAAGRQGNLEDEIARINEEARKRRQAQTPSVADSAAQQGLLKKMDQLLQALNSKPIEVSVKLDKQVVGRAARDFIGKSLDPTRDYVS